MRIALGITIVAMLASGESSGAQTAAMAKPATVARRFIDRQLSDSAFRSLHCVSGGFGDCPGGVQIVGGYALSDGVAARDTLRYAVAFQIVGIVGVSEGGPFFMPRAWVDSGEVVVARRGGHWVVRSPRRIGDKATRTTAAVARGYFDLDAADRRLLDTAIAGPHRP
jgi:hypothetical protein